MGSRRVLVTGAGGFVGSHLVPLLAATDHVVALGNDPVREALRPHVARELAVDLRDADALREAVREAAPDAVIHLAAQSSAARSFQDPSGTFASNVLGSWNLLLAIRDVAPRARVVWIGTGEVYGPQEPGTRVAEDGAFHPVNPYALSKAVGDAAAAGAASAFGLDVVRARPFAHTGPGQTPTFVIPAWAEQIARIERGEAEPVLKVGNLEVTRDVSDVRDVVAAYDALIERGRAGAAYNVCSGRGVSLAEIAQRLCAMARVPVRIETDPERVRAADIPYLVGDPSAIQGECGWSAERPLDATLADVLASWRSGAHA